MMMPKRIIIQNNPEPSTTQVSFELYLRCMKYSTTRLALNDGHAERHQDIQGAEIDVGNGHGGGRQHHQRSKDAEVHAERRDVLVAEVCVASVGVHARSHPCRFTRYSSGNRKIQTMSTKCQ